VPCLAQYLWSACKHTTPSPTFPLSFYPSFSLSSLVFQSILCECLLWAICSDWPWFHLVLDLKLCFGVTREWLLGPWPWHRCYICFLLLRQHLSSTQFDFATFSLSLEIYIFYDTRWSTAQSVCSELVQSIMKNISICLLCYCHNTHHMFYFTCMIGMLTCAHHYQLVRLPWETYMCCHGAMWFSLTLNTYPYSLWHSTCIKYRKGKWSIPFLFLLSCAAVTMDCANSTQPSNLQCQFGLSPIIFYYYSINCMDIYEVHVFKAWRSTWVSDWYATKSGKVRLIINNWPYLKIRLKLTMSLSLNHSQWHGLKQSHRQGWRFQLIKKKKFPF
jgi:hypothetical protein